MAHIQKRGPSKYRARNRGPDGREHSRTFTRKGDAERYLATVEVEKSRGQWVDPSLARQTFGAFSERWLATQVHLAATTHQKVRGHLENHLIPTFGDMQLAAMQPSHVRSWIAEVLESGRSESTVLSVASTLRQILNSAVDDGILGRSPCHRVRLPRLGPAKKRPVIDPVEIIRLANEIHPRYRALIFLAAYCGMRWGEVAGLHPDQVDLKRGMINVSGSLAEVRGKLLRQPTKSDKRRSVSLPPFLCDILAKHIEQHSSAEYVFTSPAFLPLRRSNWYRRYYKPAIVAAGVDPALTFHDLRRTCVALAVDQGAHPKAVQERLGHASIRITLDTYGELFPALDEKLVDDLNRAHFEALAASPRPEPQIVVSSEPEKTPEPPAEQGVHVERTTRFEPATLTLAR